ncbi:MAG: hypothetical protein AAFR35_08090 [Pseudomonadota bacterium]
MGAPDRTPYLTYIAAQRHPADFAPSVETFFAPDASVHAVHPFNHVGDGAGYHARVLAPLQTAFEGLYRRDDIVMAGAFEGANWVSATGYYAGRFAHDWIGLRATGHLAYLRFGEFHRLEAGQAVESYVFLDLPELMVSTGQWPIATGPGRTRGHTGMIHGPATRDGVRAGADDPAEGEESYRIVTEMLAGLATLDEEWRPYWHPNMMWYGPGAFGSFIGIEQFASFQVPFESQFDGWSGGSAGNGLTRHFTRYGEGPYTCSGGWPSLTGISVQPFLETGPTQARIFMRVCDWWRREGDLLVENWVFVDVPDVLRQMGRDLFAGVEVAP